MNGPVETPTGGLHLAALILAAGASSRMGASGQHKLLALFDGAPLVRRVTERVLASGVDQAVLVTGHRADEIAMAVDGLACEIVFNAEFEAGMASSLKAGLSSVAGRAHGVMVVLADMPALTREHLAMLASAFRAHGGAAIVRASGQGRRGNPVILPKSTFAAMGKLQGDIGAKPVIESSGLPIVDIDIGAAAHVDADTPEAILAAGGVMAR
jgi:molybdenum cofactor cytidylyltransferase